MSAPSISPAPWDLAAGNRWSLRQDGYTDHGNESIIAKDGQIVAFVAGGMENGNGAMLAAAPTLAEALRSIVQRHDRDASATEPGFQCGCKDCRIATEALQKAGAS